MVLNILQSKLSISNLKSAEAKRKREAETLKIYERLSKNLKNIPKSSLYAKPRQPRKTVSSSPHVYFELLP